MSKIKESSKTPAKVIIDIPDEILTLMDKFINIINLENQKLIADVLHIVPYVTLLRIIECKPQSKVKIIECVDDANGKITHSRYATWTKLQLVPQCVRNVNWTNFMGKVTNQQDHDVCWAIVAVDIIRAIRLIEGRERDPNIQYSSQDLIDFADPIQRAKVNIAGHYCYTFSIIKAMQYVMKNGIQKEDDRPFRGCSKEIPDRISPQFGCIKDYKILQTIDEMLLQLQHQPIGAAVAMFSPEYNITGNNIYRGPGLQKSKLIGLHAISLVAVGEENGERYLVAKASHGESFGCNGYLKISLEIMIVYVPIPGEIINEKAKKYFGTPRLLIRRFSYPQLFSLEEEENQKRMHQI